MKSFEEFLDPFRFEKALSEKYSTYEYDRIALMLKEQKKLYEGYYMSCDADKLKRLLVNAGIDERSISIERAYDKYFKKELVQAFLINASFNEIELIRDKFDNILKVGGWFLSSEKIDNNRMMISLENRRGVEVTAEVEKLYPKLYHITEKKNVKSILKHGLKAKNSNTTSIFRFPERLYFLVNKEDWKEVANKLYSFKNVEELVLLEVDTKMYKDYNHVGLRFYLDPKCEGAVYTLEDIYCDCMTVIDDSFTPDKDSEDVKEFRRKRGIAQDFLKHIKDHPYGI